MATPDNRNSETAEQWVLLEHDGDTGKDVLLHNQDGDERVGKENDLKVAEVLDGNQNTGLHSISSCFRSAWNDVVVRKALWEDQRPYVFLIALSVNAVLILLAALTSLTECYNLQVTLTCLRHAALAMLYAAAFSCATRFFSLLAVKASVAKNFEMQYLLIKLSGFTTLNRLFTCFGSLYHVGSCIMVYQKARREEYFAWYVQLPADVVKLQALTGAMVVSAALTFLMGTDIRALRRASLRLSLELWEARRRGDAPWWPKRGILEGLAAMARGSLKEVIITLAMMAPLIIIFTLSPDGALSFRVTPGASAGT